MMPNLAATAEAITGSLQHLVSLTYTPAGASTPTPLLADRLEVEFDEGWTPQITLDATVPAAEVTFDELDPRPGLSIDVEAGYVLPGGIEDRYPLGTLRGHISRANEQAGTIDLRAFSEEIRTQERPMHNSRLSDMPTTGVREAVQYLIGYSMPERSVPPALTGTLPAGYRPDVLTEIKPVAGQPVWTLLEEILAASETRLYVDSFGQWIIGTTPSEAAAVPSHVLADGVAGTVITRAYEHSRDEFSNYVLRVHRWRDDAGNDREVVGAARIESGPLSIWSAGIAGRVYESTVPTSQGNATSGARAMLRKAATMGGGHEITAIAAYWLRPGDTVHIVREGKPTEAHLVAKIRFDLLAGSMALTTRKPLNAYTIITGDTAA